MIKRTNYKDRDLMLQRMRDAWTPERRKAFGEYIKEQYRVNPERAKRVSDGVKGIPKSEVQKRRMSEAKLGVPKSEEHRTSMSEAHKIRHIILKDIMDSQDLTFKEATIELKLNRQYYYDEYAK